MNNNEKMICDICSTIFDRTNFMNFDNKIINETPILKEIKLSSLCIWCLSSLKRTVEFLKFIVEMRRKSKTCIDKTLLQKHTKGVYTLSVHQNKSIDILPTFREIFIPENNGNINDEETTIDGCLNNKNVDLNNIGIIKDDEQDKMLNKDNNIKSCKMKKPNCKEIMFEMKLLSQKEQFKEIEDKRSCEKYLKMPYKCHKCGIGYLTEDIFDDHEKRHDEKAGAYTCRICELRFKSPLVLSQHMLSHSRLFLCMLCNRKFRRWTHAQMHRLKCDVITHTSVCECCGKIFDNEISLRNHKEGVHERVERYSCERCNRKFFTKLRLRIHMRLHTGIKPFSCDICNKRFTTNSNLTAHKKSHLSERNFYCVECNKNYKSEKYLKKHFMSSKHVKDSEKLYSCIICHKKFFTEKSLSSHLRVRHDTKYVCGTCEKNFSSSSNLKRHQKSTHNAIINEK